MCKSRRDPISSSMMLATVPLQERKLSLRKSHTHRSSISSSYGILAWIVSLGDASSSRTSMANQDPLLGHSKNQEPFLRMKNKEPFFVSSWTKNPRNDLLLPLSWILLEQSYWTPWESRDRNMIQAILKIFLVIPTYDFDDCQTLVHGFITNYFKWQVFQEFYSKIIAFFVLSRFQLVKELIQWRRLTIAHKWILD